MDVGLFVFLTDRSPGAALLAQAAEERGFDLLLVPEHTHIPVARTALSPTGGVLADEHRRSLDPFVALGVAAAVTTKLAIGTGICLVAQHDPITLAKAVATLDFVSSGRFIFGIGHGWHPEEVGNHGIDPRRRRAIAREKVMAMKAIWTQETASWDGPYVRFTPLYSWPKPSQQPHPPILLGGSPNEDVLRDVIDYADGWMPYAWFHDPASGWARLCRLAEDNGRDPATLELAVMGARANPGDLERWRELGARRVVFDLPDEGWDDMRARMDRYASLLAEVRSGARGPR